ncbi:hypothetical protein P154DRAFT_573329 [Amniculicola lignicola CBS 123094]|uniref:Uncharacterized protein n=1 Tax=Amniculicola lignicola CBS 123094 TaxID=1392246 RepID=A0A6A5WN92_9PLEO|nr:hypothetical protein P154DRAFT_573329 [Amniculicola lignicola CBS 123094]
MKYAIFLPIIFAFSAFAQATKLQPNLSELISNAVNLADLNGLCVKRLCERDDPTGEFNPQTCTKITSYRKECRNLMIRSGLVNKDDKTKPLNPDILKRDQDPVTRCINMCVAIRETQCGSQQLFSRSSCHKDKITKQCKRDCAVIPPELSQQMADKAVEKIERDLKEEFRD